MESVPRCGELCADVAKQLERNGKRVLDGRSNAREAGALVAQLQGTAKEIKALLKMLRHYMKNAQQDTSGKLTRIIRAVIEHQVQAVLAKLRQQLESAVREQMRFTFADDDDDGKDGEGHRPGSSLLAGLDTKFVGSTSPTRCICSSLKPSSLA